MTNSFTLEDVKASIRKQFAPFEIALADGTRVTMTSTLRLKDDERESVNAALKKVSDLSKSTEADKLELIVENVAKIFHLVADKPTKLLAELADDDLDVKSALMLRVLNAWMEDTEAGEA